jgi:hypothetical protein
MNLAIIFTGQIRTFYTYKIQESIKQLIKLSKANYTNIVIVTVINGEYDENMVKNTFDILSVPLVIVDYNNYIQEYNDMVDSKINSEEYQKLKHDYFQKNTSATREVYNIDDNTRFNSIQPHLIKVGIDTLLDYEKENNIKYDVIMKTRFDMAYPDTFYPNIPEGTLLSKLTFNESLKDKFLKGLKENNLDIDSLIPFLKNQKINSDNCRINMALLQISFGGDFCYNYKSLENILNGSDEILYSFNDFYFFGKRDIFLKFKRFSEEMYIKPTSLDIPHFYITESQMCIFCDNNNIDYLMYHPREENYWPVR